MAGMDPGVLFMIGVIPVSGLVAGLWLSARLWAVVDTPTVQAGHAFPGRIEVRGRCARPGGAPPITSPLTGEACAWWSVEVEQRVGSGKNRRWKRRALHASGRVSVHDDTGHVLVEVPDTGPISVHLEILDPQELPSVTTSMLAAVAAGTPLHGLAAPARREGAEPSLAARLVLAVATPFSPDADLSRLSDSWRVVERRVGDGEEFYALGHATVTDEGLLIAPSERGRVVTFRGDERAFVSRLRSQAWGALGAFVIGTGLAAAAVSGTPEGTSQIQWDVPVGLLGAWLALLWLLAVQAVRVRNRIVAARQQVLAAWRLISVADQRRATLAPQLAETVRAAMAHERRVLELLAEARTRSERAAGTPTAEHVSESSAAHQAGRGVVSILREAMPELRTQPNAAQLFEQLVALEDGVAAARSYYNDARTVLTDRITTVPDAWLAPLAGPIPAELLLDGSGPGSAPPGRTPGRTPS